jgi:hypothetical protein
MHERNAPNRRPLVKGLRGAVEAPVGVVVDVLVGVVEVVAVVVAIVVFGADE